MDFDNYLPAKLNADQKKAFELCLKYDRVLILGGAGTGKSTLIKTLNHYFESKGLNVKLCATTGKAATLIGGETLNRLAQVPTSFDILHNLKQKFTKMEIKKGQPKIKDVQYVTMPAKIKCADVIICDEVSMMLPETFYYFSELLKFKNKTTKLIFVGDFSQLPCVTTNEIKNLKTQNLEHLYINEWQFLLPFDKYFISQNWKIAKLNEVMRCQNQKFNKEAANIAKNIFNKTINNFFTISDDFPDIVNKILYDNYICITPLKDTVNQINTICISKLSTKTKKFDCDIPFEAKTGMRIMSIINDKHEPMRYQNGSLGNIIGFQDNEIVVKFDDYPTPINIKQQIFQENHYDYIANVYDNISYDSQIAEKLVKTKPEKFSYIPLIPAYAITVHKAQGSGFSKLVLILGDYAFSSGLLYTMITRCKDPSQAILSRPLRKKDIKIFPQILELNALIDNENRLFTSKELDQKYLEMHKQK